MKKCPLIFGAAVVAAAATFAAPPAAPSKPVVEIGSAVVTDNVESRRYTGQITSLAEVRIMPRVSGEILEIGFADGSIVSPGQMLYRLDPTQYEAAVKSAEAKIAECKAKLEYAQHNYDRNSMLYEKQAASRDTLENTKSALDAFKASLLAAEAELITARDNLKNTVITAPIKGIAGVTLFTVGNYLTPSSGELVSIIQAQPIRVRFSISTADFLAMFGSLEELRGNGEIKLRLADGSEYDEPGTIEFINNSANRRTDAIEVFAVFPNRERRLIVGSTVGVTLFKKQGRQVVAVPPSAVVYDSRGAAVYVVGADNRVEKRAVAAGNATGELQLIHSGLAAGERVVVKGTHKLSAGVEIEPAAVQEK